MSYRCPYGSDCQTGVTSDLEAIVTATGFCGERLAAEPAGVMAALPTVDLAVAVTLNPCTVMTHIGPYDRPMAAGDPLRFAEGRTALRFAAAHIDTVMMIDGPAMGRMPRSLQLFSPQGTVLHRAFLSSVADAAAYRDLRLRLTSFRSAGCASSSASSPVSPACWPMAKGIDVARLEAADVDGHLDSLFADYGVSRRMALPAVRGARRVRLEAVCDALSLMTQARMPVMQAAGNAGVMQLHRGMLERLRHSDNILLLTAGKCTTSIDLAQIEEAWLCPAGPAAAPRLLLELYDWRYHCVYMLTDAGDGQEWARAAWGRIAQSLATA
ncbi:MAG: ChuX/HutX family heme-like substrate-binding protein [Pseudochelatococcus sp.]|jgi:putative heme degradation protein|uniref:ChuX/HutX family heme-like substrate-binding protein n=1 Tax=Pseudochelatococcus sp. TaxID=2020869 RepID=UPI003D9046E2